MNEIYKETIKDKKFEILNYKYIWIPCFDIYQHFKCLTNNSVGTIHEYIKINNINMDMSSNIEKLFKNKINTFQVKPDTKTDIILKNDFCLGIVNNIEDFINKDKNEKEDKNENEENNNEDFPYIIFLSYVDKNDFITEILK